MCEKVVSNLLSNALEHTFSGEIAVELRHRTYHAELIVRDTGIGIAEGSGIRLCVVQEPGRCPQVRAARCTAMTGRSAATWA